MVLAEGSTFCLAENTLLERGDGRVLHVDSLLQLLDMQLEFRDIPGLLLIDRKHLLDLGLHRCQRCPHSRIVVRTEG